MKYLIVILLFFSSLLAAEGPTNGMFRCLEGNNNSVCDQDIRVKASSIKVMYEGDCGGQGPYTYYCEGDECGDAGVRITFRDKDHYRWENIQYNIYCEMEKVK